MHMHKTIYLRFSARCLLKKKMWKNNDRANGKNAKRNWLNKCHHNAKIPFKQMPCHHALSILKYYNCFVIYIYLDCSLCLNYNSFPLWKLWQHDENCFSKTIPFFPNFKYTINMYCTGMGKKSLKSKKEMFNGDHAPCIIRCKNSALLFLICGLTH